MTKRIPRKQPRGYIGPPHRCTWETPLTRAYHWTLLHLGIRRELTWLLFDSLRWATLFWLYGLFALGMVAGDLLSWRTTVALLGGMAPATLLAHVFWAGRR